MQNSDLEAEHYQRLDKEWRLAVSVKGLKVSQSPIVLSHMLNNCDQFYICRMSIEMLLRSLIARKESPEEIIQDLQEAGYIKKSGPLYYAGQTWHDFWLNIEKIREVKIINEVEN